MIGTLDIFKQTNKHFFSWKKGGQSKAVRPHVDKTKEGNCLPSSPPPPYLPPFIVGRAHQALLLLSDTGDPLRTKTKSRTITPWQCVHVNKQRGQDDRVAQWIHGTCVHAGLYDRYGFYAVLQDPNGKLPPLRHARYENCVTGEEYPCLWAAIGDPMTLMVFNFERVSSAHKVLWHCSQLAAA